ncbi:MAG: hypothetical protein LBJ64_12760 [Deltaproteobacteria bacterium]|jgi:hypothetical protein|nr:hypothetical protein [Deltaproteobacteria bacterium]
MDLIIFKLILPPILILSASLAGRRWGDAIGGWVVGLPLTSGPVAAFLAIQYGPEFASLSANGSLVGTAAQAWFSLGYAYLARHGCAAAFLGGTAAYAGTAFLFQAVPMSNLACFGLGLASLTVVIKLIPRRRLEASPVAMPWWDLPARMLTVTVIVLAVTAAASSVGAQIAGLLATFPVFGSTMAIFAHRLKGPEMAAQILRGMALGLYGFAGFFFILSLTLTRIGTVPAFLAAIASALIIQAVMLKTKSTFQVGAKHED